MQTTTDRQREFLDFIWCSISHASILGLHFSQTMVSNPTQRELWLDNTKKTHKKNSSMSVLNLEWTYHKIWQWFFNRFTTTFSSLPYKKKKNFVHFSFFFFNLQKHSPELLGCRESCSKSHSMDVLSYFLNWTPKTKECQRRILLKNCWRSRVLVDPSQALDISISTSHQLSFPLIFSILTNLSSVLSNNVEKHPFLHDPPILFTVIFYRKTHCALLTKDDLTGEHQSPEKAQGRTRLNWFVKVTTSAWCQRAAMLKKKKTCLPHLLTTLPRSHHAKTMLSFGTNFV